jgi:hypothetical protein
MQNRRLVLALGGAAGIVAVVAGLAGFGRVAGVAAAMLLLVFMLASWMNDREAISDKTEARAILHREMETWKALSRIELRGRIGTIETPQVTGISGTHYQIEIEPIWDATPGGAIRVLGAIDDGGLHAFVPITHDFLVAPEV